VAGGGEHGRRKNTGDTALKIYAVVTPVHHQHVLKKTCHFYHQLCASFKDTFCLFRDFAFCSFTLCNPAQLSESSTASYFCSQHSFQNRVLFFLLLPAPISESSTTSYFCSQHNYQNRAQLFYFSRTVFAFKMGVKIFWNWHDRVVFTETPSFKSNKIVSSLQRRLLSNPARYFGCTAPPFFLSLHELSDLHETPFD
jgi:hypothetical protein